MKDSITNILDQLGNNNGTRDEQVVLTDSIDSHEVPDEVVLLAQQLSVKHGNVRVTREAGGIHLYMASPICLQEYGEEELWKMHLAVNAEKYLRGEDLAAQCMKTGKAFKVSTLLNWDPLQSRGYADASHRIKIIDKEDLLTTDNAGNKVPPGPGTTVGLLELPANHVAIRYLEGRGFDIHSLCRQFGAEYCTEENNDVYYRKLLGGFRATPQERIVFYSDIYGVRRGWQARIIDRKCAGTDGRFYHFYWHPYRRGWVAVRERQHSRPAHHAGLPNTTAGNPPPYSSTGFSGPDDSSGCTTQDTAPVWNPVDGFENWDDAKYIIATGAKRNQMLLGFDAAVAFNEGHVQPWIGLAEGPLDAARLGPPFCAVMGKSFGIKQAELCEPFSRVVFAVQNDEYSARLENSIISRMSARGIPVTVIRPDPEYNDFGEMTTERSAQILSEAL